MVSFVETINSSLTFGLLCLIVDGTSCRPINNVPSTHMPVGAKTKEERKPERLNQRNDRNTQDDRS